MDFQFQNKEHFQISSRKELLSEKKIKKFFVFTSITFGLCFIVLKTLWFYSHNPSVVSYFKEKPKLFKEKEQKNAHTLPLLLNLKGEKGPQLFKVQVSITLSQNSPKEDFFISKQGF